MSDATATTLPDLPAAVRQYMVDHYERWPVHSNRASQLGHPCLRRLVYQRTRWRDAAAPDPDLLSTFQEGALHEQAVIRQIDELGRYRVIHAQAAFEYPEHRITGRIDGQVLIEGVSYPLDVKSMSPFSWHEIRPHDAASVREHPHYYVRGYYDQMVLYCLLANKPIGLLILKNKVTGALKQVEIELDYTRAEELVQKADAVNRHVDAGTLPDRIPYEQAVCGRCEYFHICLPDEALLHGLVLSDDAELAAMLRRRAELEDAAREYERVQREIKQRALAALAEDGQAAVGTEWLLRVTTRTRKGYTVAPSTYREVQIERVGRAQGEA